MSNEKFCNLGLNPVTLEGSLMDEVNDITQKYQDRLVKAYRVEIRIILLIPNDWVFVFYTFSSILLPYLIIAFHITVLQMRQKESSPFFFLEQSESRCRIIGQSKVRKAGEKNTLLRLNVSSSSCIPLSLNFSPLYHLTFLFWRLVELKTSRHEWPLLIGPQSTGSTPCDSAHFNTTFLCDPAVILIDSLCVCSVCVCPALPCLALLPTSLPTYLSA